VRDNESWMVMMEVTLLVAIIEEQKFWLIN